MCVEENNGYQTSLSFKDKKKKRDLSIINYNKLEGLNIQRAINYASRFQEKSITEMSIKNMKYFYDFGILDLLVKRNK